MEACPLICSNTSFSPQMFCVSQLLELAPAASSRHLLRIVNSMLCKSKSTRKLRNSVLHPSVSKAKDVSEPLAAGERDSICVSGILKTEHQIMQDLIPTSISERSGEKWKTTTDVLVDLIP